MSCERALNFDQWKTFSENYKPMRVWLWLVYKFTENYYPSRLFSKFIQTQRRYPSSPDKIYPNSKTTCHIKLKFFLWAKLLENLLLAKYFISVTAPLIMLNNISHSSILWQKYFITFAIVSTYFLSKLVCNRNNTFMKNSSQLLKLLKHGRSCKFGYLFLFRFSASKFSIAISYLV